MRNWNETHFLRRAYPEFYNTCRVISNERDRLDRKVLRRKLRARNKGRTLVDDGRTGLSVEPTYEPYLTLINCNSKKRARNLTQLKKLSKERGEARGEDVDQTTEGGNTEGEDSS